jgi:hypothetical protein
LPKQFGISALDFVDLKPLPQSLIEVSKFVNSPRPESERLADDLRGPDHMLSRAAV